MQSSRRAISALDSPSLANSTILARSTSRCDRVYCPARRRSSRSSAPLSSIRYLLATANKIRRHRYDFFNQPGAYFRERPLALIEGRWADNAALDLPLRRRVLARLKDVAALVLHVGGYHTKHLNRRYRRLELRLPFSGGPSAEVLACFLEVNGSNPMGRGRTSALSPIRRDRHAIGGHERGSRRFADGRPPSIGNTHGEAALAGGGNGQPSGSPTPIGMGNDNVQLNSGLRAWRVHQDPPLRLLLLAHVPAASGRDRPTAPDTQRIGGPPRTELSTPTREPST